MSNSSLDRLYQSVDLLGLCNMLSNMLEAWFNENEHQQNILVFFNDANNPGKIQFSFTYYSQQKQRLGYGWAVPVADLIEASQAGRINGLPRDWYQQIIQAIAHER
ncbi:MAG TPA: hypothetical protein V6C57_16790 [Coleofasciculaceae cyanobacterium]